MLDWLNSIFQLGLSATDAHINQLALTGHFSDTMQYKEPGLGLMALEGTFENSRADTSNRQTSGTITGEMLFDFESGQPVVLAEHAYQ